MIILSGDKSLKLLIIFKLTEQVALYLKNESNIKSSKLVLLTVQNLHKPILKHVTRFKLDWTIQKYRD